MSLNKILFRNDFKHPKHIVKKRRRHKSGMYRCFEDATQMYSLMCIEFEVASYFILRRKYERFHIYRTQTIGKTDFSLDFELVSPSL